MALNPIGPTNLAQPPLPSVNFQPTEPAQPTVPNVQPQQPGNAPMNNLNQLPLSALPPVNPPQQPGVGQNLNLNG